VGYQEDAQDFLEDFLAKLSVGEKEEQLALAEGWDTVSTILESKINTLVEIAAPSRNQLYQTDKYKDFLKTAKEQVSFYSGQAEGIISGTQADNILMGEIVNEFVLGVPLGSIPIEATNNMIGMTSEGAPLYDLLSNSYPETVMNLTDTLIEGTALGKNPEDIARDMVEDMDGNFSRALTIARTEEMNAFREASREAMTNSGMIEEWEWLAEPDACDECLEQNGKTFPIDEPMDTHPNCRCAELPVIPSDTSLAVQEPFDRQAYIDEKGIVLSDKRSLADIGKGYLDLYPENFIQNQGTVEERLAAFNSASKAEKLRLLEQQRLVVQEAIADSFLTQPSALVKGVTVGGQINFTNLTKLKIFTRASVTKPLDITFAVRSYIRNSGISSIIDDATRLEEIEKVLEVIKLEMSRELKKRNKVPGLNLVIDTQSILEEIRGTTKRLP